MNKPTEEYSRYQSAFDYFNAELFGGRLPPCLITLQRTHHARGYYSSLRFAARNNYTLRADEIALNPDTFLGRSDKEILSTLVHEQTHCGKHMRAIQVGAVTTIESGPAK